VIFNIAGLVILLAGFGSMYVLAFLSPKREWNPLYLIVLVWIGLDLLYRASFSEFRFFDPDHGGHIFYVPLWVLGVALGVYSKLEDSKFKRSTVQPDSALDRNETAAELNPRPADPRPDAKPPRIPRARPAFPDRRLEHKATRWSIRLNECHQRMIVGRHFYVVEGYPPEYWKQREPFCLTFSEIDCQSGEKRELPALSVTGSFTTGQAIGVKGAVFANAGRYLARLGRGAKEWRVVAERSDATISGPPLHIHGSVVCAWVCSDESVLVSCTASKASAWSRPIAADYVQALFQREGCVYLVAHTGSGAKGERRSSVYVFELDSLDVLRTKELPFQVDAAAMGDETIYLAGAQSFRVLPPGPFEIAGPRSIDDLNRHPGLIRTYQVRDGELAGEYDSGKRSLTTLLCQEARDLSSGTLQPLASHDAHDISILSDGILVTSSDSYQCAVERLDNPAGRLSAVACCPGDPVSSPAKLGSAVVWLVRDCSFEDLARAIRGHARANTRYRLLSLNHTGKVESFIFDWGEAFDDLLALSPELLVLAGPNRAVAVPANELGLEQTASRASILAARAQGGPRIDLWAYDHSDEFLSEILQHLVKDGEAFWTLAPEKRYEVLFALREHWVREIGLCLPVPGTAEDGTVTSGGLSQRFVNAGRFLLFEFIRENKHQISINDKVWPYVQSAFFRQVVSWCNREALQRHEVLAKLPRLSSKWQTGAVSLFDDWRQYADLAGDLLACNLLGGKWRSPLEDAIRRVWRSSLHPRKRHVFISYSHRDVEPARRLARGLEDRGVGVAFDGWQPETEVDERQVEMWIAENVISSNKVVYLISSNALASGWIRRECEWERRMLGLRETFELPLLVTLDVSVVPEGYPADLVFDASGLLAGDDDELLNAIAGRISPNSSRRGHEGDSKAAL
jgi:hypothetical protein